MYEVPEVQFVCVYVRTTISWRLHRSTRMGEGDATEEMQRVTMPLAEITSSINISIHHAQSPMNMVEKERR
jgi:hypothetical protein